MRRATVADRALTLRRTRRAYRRSFLVATDQHRHDLQESRATTTRRPLSTRWEGRFTVLLNSRVLSTLHMPTGSTTGRRRPDRFKDIPAAQLRVLRMHIANNPDVRRLHYPASEKRMMYDGDYFRRPLYFHGQLSVRELFFDPSWHGTWWCRRSSNDIRSTSSSASRRWQALPTTSAASGIEAGERATA